MAYLALCGPVLWSSNEDDADSLWSWSFPDSSPNDELHLSEKGERHAMFRKLYYTIC